MTEDQEKDYYTEEEIIAILEVFDSIENPRLPQLVVGGHREERIKSNSNMGKRNLRLTSRLRRIYNLASKESWSDTYLFVRDKCFIQDEEILISEDSVGRALKQLCEKANVRYLPPHQIRFANATQMARNGAEAYPIQKFLGHTTPIMSTRYIRAYEKNDILSGSTWTQNEKKNPKRFVHKHLRLSQSRCEPDLKIFLK